MNPSVSARKLWRDPQRGKLMGVCAGLSEYLNVPVTLIRIMVIISLFIGLFMITVVVYFSLGYFLEKRTPSADGENAGPADASALMEALESEAGSNERRIRDIERYGPSETFSERSPFRQRSKPYSKR